MQPGRIPYYQETDDFELQSQQMSEPVSKSAVTPTLPTTGQKQSSLAIDSIDNDDYEHYYVGENLHSTLHSTRLHSTWTGEDSPEIFSPTSPASIKASGIFSPLPSPAPHPSPPFPTKNPPVPLKKKALSPLHSQTAVNRNSSTNASGSAHTSPAHSPARSPACSPVHVHRPNTLHSGGSVLSGYVNLKPTPIRSFSTDSKQQPSDNGVLPSPTPNSPSRDNTPPTTPTLHSHTCATSGATATATKPTVSPKPSLAPKPAVRPKPSRTLHHQHTT